MNGNPWDSSSVKKVTGTQTPLRELKRSPDRLADLRELLRGRGKGMEGKEGEGGEGKGE